MMWRLLISPKYFIWMFVPIFIFIFVQIFGKPHFIWNYQYQLTWDFSEQDYRRHYTQCTFVGEHGEITISSKNGACDWLIFRKNNGDR